MEMSDLEVLKPFPQPKKMRRCDGCGNEVLRTAVEECCIGWPVVDYIRNEPTPARAEALAALERHENGAHASMLPDEVIVTIRQALTELDSLGV